MRFGTFLKLFDTFYDMMFVGKSLRDMKVVYYSKEASYFRDRGAPERAVESYHKALRLDPDNFYVHTRLAHLFAGRSEFQHALENADHAFQSKTLEVVRSWRIYLNFVRLVIFQMLEKCDEARTVFDRLLLSLGGDIALVYNRLAGFYFDFGIYHKAVYYYKEAIAFRPEEPEFHDNLASAYLADGKPEEARESLLAARQFARSIWQRRKIDRRIRKINGG